LLEIQTTSRLTPQYIVQRRDKKRTTFTICEIFFHTCYLFLHICSHFWSCSKIFTKLPLNVSKLYTNTTTFKSVLRKFLVKNVLYSIDLFLSTNYGVN
jgi:hypothetical protein